MGPLTDWRDEEELGFLAEEAKWGFPLGPDWGAERAEGEYPAAGRHSVETHLCADLGCVYGESGSPTRFYHTKAKENKLINLCGANGLPIKESL